MFVAPTAGVSSPLLWGKLEAVHSRLLRGVSEFQFCRRVARLQYPFSSVGTVEFFRKFYGPTQRAFAALDPERQIALRRQLEYLQCEHNLSSEPDQTDTPAEYLQVIAHRRREL
jgi:hypothetical protein